MSWKPTILGAHVDLISGPAFKSNKFTDDPSNIPLVKGENLGQGEILWEKSKFWPRDEFNEYKRYLLEPGDVVLAMDRPWVTAGLKYAVINDRDPQSLLVQRVARLRGENGLQQGFLRYIISSNEFTGYVKNIMGGTNVPHISGDQIRAYEFKLPEKGVQNAIVAILSAYDDLIENNRRRIQLLEESARLLYKEWFVRLRFPGHDHVKVVDGVPEGWKVGTIGDLGEVITGKTPSKKKTENYGNDLSFIKTPDMHGNAIVIHTAESLSETGAKTQAKKTLPPRSILVSCIGTVGAVAFNASPAQTNQQINSIVPADDLVTYWVYFMAKALKPLLEGMGGGATMANVNKTKFSGIKIVVPSRQLLGLFFDFSKPIFDQIETIADLNLQLAQARDLLLPRLMNGEVAV